MPKGSDTTKRNKRGQHNRAKVGHIIELTRRIMVKTTLEIKTSTVETKPIRPKRRRKDEAAAEPSSIVLTTEETVVLESKTITETTKSTVISEKQKTEILTVKSFSTLHAALSTAKAAKIKKLTKLNEVSQEEVVAFQITVNLFKCLPKLLSPIVKEINDLHGYNLELEFYELEKPYQAKQTKEGVRLEMHNNVLSGATDIITPFGISLFFRMHNLTVTKTERPHSKEKAKAAFLKGLKSAIDQIIGEDYRAVIWEKEQFNALYVDIGGRERTIEVRSPAKKEMLRPRAISGKWNTIRLLLEEAEHAC